MNIIMKRTLLSFATAAILSSAGVAQAADASGTVTLNGTIDAATCTVTGLDGAKNFSRITLADLSKTGVTETATTVELPISFTLCPKTITKANIAVSWSIGADATKMAATGDARGMDFSAFSSASPTTALTSGEIVPVDVSSGSADTLLEVRGIRNADTAAEGEFATAINFVVDYE